MGNTPNNSPDPVHIDSRDGDRLVVFTGGNEDRFVRSCRWTEEVARFGISQEVWGREVRELIGHVRDWAAEHAGSVSHCMAAWRDGQLAILVAPNSEHYDFPLADALTELDFQLAEKFRACACDVLQVPRDASKFGACEATLLIYGELRTTQSEVASES